MAELIIGVWVERYGHGNAAVYCISSKNRNSGRCLAYETKTSIIRTRALKPLKSLLSTTVNVDNDGQQLIK